MTRPMDHAPEPPSPARRWAGVVLRVAVPVAMLALLWHVAGGAEALARLASAHPGWLAAAFAAGIGQVLFCARRWQITAGALGIGLGYRRAAGEYFMAQLLNQILPGGMLGDAARVLRVRAMAGLGVATHSVVIERLSGQIALYSVLAVALGVALLRPGGVAFPPGTGVALAIGLGVVGTVMALSPALRRMRWAADFGTAVRVGLLARGMWQRQVLLSAGVVACNLLTFAFAARATGTTLSPEAVLTLVPLILTAMILPVSVGGWGWREGAAAVLFPLAGASAAAGLAASVAFGLVLLAASLPGAFVLARRGG